MKTDFLGRRRPSSLYAIAKNVVVHEVSSPATTTSPSVVWVVEAQDVPPLGIAGPVVSAIVCSEAVTDLWDRHLTDGGEARVRPAVDGFSVAIVVPGSART